MAKAKKASAKVSVDCRNKDRRQQSTRRKKDEPVKAEKRGGERREKVNRRRQIDPTTCERDYTEDEVDFMQALDEYKRQNGRMFPTCSEILEVVRDLGYVKLPKSEQAATEISTGELVVAELEAEMHVVGEQQ